jgi:hypothetical protein
MQSIAMHINPRDLFHDNPGITVDEFMQRTGLKRRAYFKHKSALGLTNQSTDADTGASEAPVRRASVPRSATRTKADTAQSAQAAAVEVVAPATGRWMLYAVFGAATVASVHNMFTVMAELTAESVSAYSLTAVFACTAVAFTAAGMRDRFTFYLILALIGFEAFCNAANMYGWLYDFSTHTATHFLQRVQSLVYFISAQHCAVVLSLFTALCIAGVQYAALRELKTRTKA